jgi:protein SCO1
MRGIVIALGLLLLAAVYVMLTPTPQVTAPAASGVGGAFELVSATTQHRFTDKDLRGKPAALFFGFTHCPDVCPTALSVASAWLKALGPDADKLHFVFITVDPERDTAASMAKYLKAFDPRIVGLTGSRAQVDGIIANYKIVAQKQPTSGNDYTYDHTALIQLFDADGDFVSTLDFEAPRETALAELKKLIAAR